MNQSSPSRELDALDRRILRALQSKGDLSQAELAEQVSASPASCWRRVRAMEKAGILQQTVRLVDPIAIGFGLDVICQIRMKTHDAASRAAFETFLLSHDQVMECHYMTGEWDYLLKIVVRGIQEYEQLLMGGLLRHEVVAASASHFSLKRVKYTTALPV